MTNINDVLLEGAIVHKFVTPKIAILTINTGNATHTPNFPKVLFFGDFIEDIDKNYEVRDYVKIIGNIQSSRRKPNVPNQNTIAIFGEGIEKSENVMKEAFGIEVESSAHRFRNEIKVAGQLIGIQKTFNNLVRLVVLTNKNNRESFVTMVHYNQDPDKVLETFKKGDNVCIIGCVQTTKKENNGEIHHFENYVANEISKL